MTLSSARAKAIRFAVTFLIAVPCAFAQHKPLTRHFAAASEEHYQVQLTLRVESHAVTTDTVAAQTYVTPAIHAVEATIRWRANRRISSVQKDGSAEIEETVAPLGESCAESPALTEKIDVALLSSLRDFCEFWSKRETLPYSETQRGLLREVAATPTALAQLGEASPQLLALWLRRAVRPCVIFPDLNFEIGAKSQQPLQPSGGSMRNARGFESAEWLDAQSDPPGATLHTVQQLAWISAALAADSKASAGQSPQKYESFFADSLTTVALEDGSVLHASRTASRITARHMDPVPGLPQPPDFSSKLTLSVTIERLP